jgi:hypothetical protein
LAGLAALFVGFELLSLTQEEQRRPGSWLLALAHPCRTAVNGDGRVSAPPGRAGAADQDSLMSRIAVPLARTAVSGGVRRPMARDRCWTGVAPFGSFTDASPEVSGGWSPVLRRHSRRRQGCAKAAIPAARS